MPGTHVSAVSEQSCRRCKDAAAVVVVRREPLCVECFVKYVHTKTIKRMESFRVRFAAQDQQRRILLPLSFGVSSVTLLHILDHHLTTQTTRTGRTGFALDVVFVDTLGLENPFPSESLLAQAKGKYPDHRYTSLPLYDVFRLLPNESSLHNLVPGLDLPNNLPVSEQLTSLINSLPSATARADVLYTLRTRLIVEHAKSTGCETIIWGDSTTKLAEKTLAETAKGRGFSLPWQVADGESPFGITFHYPLRDLLKKELVAYVDIASPSLSALIEQSSSASAQASLSSKNTTIDDLMKQYFESVEENFPSIVSNVVRTTGKLQASSSSPSDPHCSLCGMPVTDGRFGIHGWGGDQQDGSDFPSGEGNSRLCYGCTRSMPLSAMTINGRS
ncbi:cytoplasmic tRNA 2-thiolation protein 2 [Massariosphaeria phaeospora]|uniref:Cytoplasmic tRNA 2-thiolation protein 2 n=1 Tax=Massariosphaeria phaeospora TaxID=100035 RepID=A0A7C8MB26_9PLEO|nr:cytoplasmic tRNA 2-thiolation protein 2 [Massariosphaeria phaeospora]